MPIMTGPWIRHNFLLHLKPFLIPLLQPHLLKYNQTSGDTDNIRGMEDIRHINSLIMQVSIRNKGIKITWTNQTHTWTPLTLKTINRHRRRHTMVTWINLRQGTWIKAINLLNRTITRLTILITLIRSELNEEEKLFDNVQDNKSYIILVCIIFYFSIYYLLFIILTFFLDLFDLLRHLSTV